MMTDFKYKYSDVKILEDLLTLKESSTQSTKLFLIEENDKKFLALQKWWKKSEEDDWIEGKGFRLTFSDAEELSKAIQNGITKFL